MTDVDSPERVQRLRDEAWRERDHGCPGCADTLDRDADEMEERLKEQQR
jgi:hypothetical protein